MIPAHVYPAADRYIRANGGFEVFNVCSIHADKYSIFKGKLKYSAISPLWYTSFMKKNYIIIAVIIILVLLAIFVKQPSKEVNQNPVATSTSVTTATSTATTTLPVTLKETYTPPAAASEIHVTAPLVGQQISTTSLTVAGEALGAWFFEASFPAVLTDWNGKVLAQVPAQAQGDWMKAGFVAFKATLAFPKQVSGSRGYVILKNDNPSGDPARNKSVQIPVVFK